MVVSDYCSEVPFTKPPQDDRQSFKSYKEITESFKANFQKKLKEFGGVGKNSGASSSMTHESDTQNSLTR
jgi:hypothetical protein